MFWTAEKLMERRDELKRWVARAAVPVGPVRYHEGDLPGAFAPTLDDAGWPVVRPYQRIAGRPNMITWYRTQVMIPEHLGGKRLALRFGSHIANGGHNDMPESLLYIDGHPYHGLDRNHRLIFLPAEMCMAGRVIALAIQAWSGWRQYENLLWQDPELIHFDEEMDALAYDFDAVFRTLKELDDTSAAKVELLKLSEAVMAELDWMQPGSETFFASVARARAVMQQGFERLQRIDALKPIVNHIGHTHLDVAWLWTLENIKLKTARSWSSALRLMEQYPEFKWIQSQPQLYKYIKQTQPEIWEQVKCRVAEGRWEADGGMWVEADCNLSGGESLIRQFLYGMRFFREELGVDNVVLWLPDVFGYAWALPQIIRGVGLKYFMTTKISWNQFNRFPFDTFRWRGIDGTEVLTHFITAPIPNRAPESWNYTYNAEVLPDVVKGAWDLYQQKEINSEPLSSFGFGDGGGGPTRNDMEFARRLADMPGIPHVRIGRVDEYFARLEERVWTDPRLPVWNGELYLEYHRGTYTSQAQQKRNNRKLEFLLHNAELYGAMASLLTGTDYPRERLDEAWEIVLRNQFHDIIPGSSIREVYQDSAVEYQEAHALGGGALGDARVALVSALDLPEDSLVVFNPTGISRSDLVEASLPAGTVPVDEEGVPLPVQGKLVYAVDVPANGYRVFPLRQAPGGPGARGRLTVTPRLVDTPHFRMELNERGQMTGLYDKVQARQVLAPGQAANVLQAFEDKPMNYDAWDIDIYYTQKCQEVTDLVEATVEEEGPERGVLKLVWRFEDSTITQRMTVYARTPRIDFDTHVDWQQAQVLLKAAFPVQVNSTRATYEIQFGNVERPTHQNTSWDWARFESVGHKWADLSEGGYGVSLLNDCKYGYDIHNNVMRLTLIKSAIWPDPTADRGEHRFIYSIFPHAEDWFRGGTVAQGYRLNNPLTAVVEPAHQGALPSAFSLVSCPAPNVMIETVKQAESGDGIVVRLYEFGNRRGPVELVFGRPITAVFATNLLENEPREVAFAGRRLAFDITPYAIRTFVVKFG